MEAPAADRIQLECHPYKAASEQLTPTKAEMSLEPPSGRKQHKSRRNVAPKGLLLVGAHDTFVTLNCTGQMGEAVMTKGNAEKTTGPWTSNVSLPAYLGE